MKIIDLEEKETKSYFVCLEDWSDEIIEGMKQKEAWYNKIKGQGLCVKLAIDSEGKTGGMIQYLPIELSFAEGKDLYFIKCIWVHGHKKGRGNFQKRGMGKALLQAAEEDVKNKGAKGIVAWGLSLPFWMKASWFRKNGYTKVDKDSFRRLMWKPFTNDAVPPKWIKRKKKPEKIPGQVTVTSFYNGWCPAQNMAYERAKRACSTFPNKVIFNEINTFDRKIFMEWGIVDALYIDGKEVRTGPPPSYKKIEKKITKKARRL